MAERLPPLNWLRAFEASARHLSFTQAARELGLTQAAVSKQIRQLELHLNEPLFVRHARSLAPTRAAEAYLPGVRDAFARLAGTTREVFGDARGDVLTVRVSVAFAVAWLAPRLGDFRARHPQVALRVVSSVWNEEHARHPVHLDIRYGTGDWKGVQASRLTHETLTPVCAPGRGGPTGLATPEDLNDHTLIHVLGWEEGWTTWLRATGTRGVDPGGGMQVDTSLLAYEIAASGYGIALARSTLAAPFLAAGRLVRPFDRPVRSDEGFHVVSVADADHVHARTFRDWLVSSCTGERRLAGLA